MRQSPHILNDGRKEYKQRITCYMGSSFLVLIFFVLSTLNWIFFPALPLELTKVLIFFTYAMRPSLFPWLFFAPFTLWEDFFLSLTFGTTLLNCLLFAAFITLQINIIRKLDFIWSWFYLLLLLLVFEIAFYFVFSNYTLQKIPSITWISIICTWLMYPLLAPVLNNYYRKIIWLGYYYGGR